MFNSVPIAFFFIKCIQPEGELNPFFIATVSYLFVSEKNRYGINDQEFWTVNCTTLKKATLFIVYFSFYYDSVVFVAVTEIL